MDESTRKLERAALAGDPLAAIELEVHRSRQEGLTIQERLKLLVLARFELVVDYHMEWKPSVKELAQFAQRTLERIRPLKHGDKAMTYRLANEIYKEKAPEHSARRDARRLRTAAWRPFNEWATRVQDLVHGPPRAVTHSATGEYQFGPEVEHIRDVAACNQAVNNPPATDDAQILSFIQQQQRYWLSILERQS